MKSYRFLHIILYTLLSIVIFFTLYTNVRPETLDVKLLEISDQTIYAPNTYEDEVATVSKREEAYDNVQDVYTLRKEYSDNQVKLVTSIFDSILDVKEGKITKSDEEGDEGEKEASESLSLDEQVEVLKENLTPEIAEKISEEALKNLLTASVEDVELSKDAVVTAVNKVMNEEIPVEQLNKAKDNMAEDLQVSSLPTAVLNAATEIGRFAIIPNYIYDREATLEKRKQAADSVQPVQIKQGTIIVEENELISREVYRKLELVGLLKDKEPYKPFVGLAIMILLILGALVSYFERQDRPFEGKNKSLLLYCLIFAITIALMKIISLFQQIDYTHTGYIVPASMGAILVKLLLNERLAILTSIIFAICGSVIFNEGITGTFNFPVGIYYLIGCLAGILFLGKHNLRSKILQAGLFVALINIIVITSLLLIQNSTATNFEIGSYFVMAGVSGLSASVLTIGFMPFFETGFNILSTMKLIELSNPNHPLLRKILTEAPGTYHHSVMVANLSEAACEAIGANGLLARVGAYYHDIGKTKRPRYFIENQMHIDNPHDKLSPQLSKNIIINHATDGAEMLRKHKMPKEFIDIAEQHHGTSLLKFFYYKAKEKGDQLTEEEFRYPGPKPQTKEIAVISIADSVEAAVRSMANPSPEKIVKLVKSIISDRLQDGQLDQCDLTLKELDIVATTLCETLKGIFHSRIEYPEITKQKVKQA
ncbi:HD family phosphohydrolase [Metabacillus arenae]|uniref:HD family phosphohydrolase n=1 Tax=Metabacillus arenae TaxID=2771434 RepID=A0A926NIR7_9BACI|nr:HD family phosphohydrolase [Metabacillus arenae]MBD1382106.1 HD family phosphohydrolase [Metabacillus arenae]